MRILQLIDSLEPGGAERMAVSYANALAEKISFSGLVATRKEGELKVQIDPTVDYLFLDKRKALDPKAIYKLKRYCQQNEIQFIHAHSSSFFLAVLLKCVYPKVKIIWHDHYGNRPLLSKSQNRILIYSSVFFNGVISVNRDLESWAKKNLFVDKVDYMPNFTVLNESEDGKTVLKGEAGKRIICLANLHHPKNHKFLLEAFLVSGIYRYGWTLHLVGNDKNDEYSNEIKLFISENKFDESVFIYGKCSDILPILSQSDIGVLSSTFEGLPVALLEYGWCAKPVIATAVGDIPKVIRNCESGLLVPSNDVLAFSKALVTLIQNQDLRSQFGSALRTEILKNYSQDTVINQYLAWLKML